MVVNYDIPMHSSDVDPTSAVVPVLHHLQLSNRNMSMVIDYGLFGWDPKYDRSVTTTSHYYETRSRSIRIRYSVLV